MLTTDYRAISTACVADTAVAIIGSDNSIGVIVSGSWHVANKLQYCYVLCVEYLVLFHALALVPYPLVYLSTMVNLLLKHLSIEGVDNLIILL